jgi:hypothetical protein
VVASVGLVLEQLQVNKRAPRCAGRGIIAVIRRRPHCGWSHRQCSCRMGSAPIGPKSWLTAEQDTPSIPSPIRPPCSPSEANGTASARLTFTVQSCADSVQGSEFLVSPPRCGHNGVHRDAVSSCRHSRLHVGCTWVRVQKGFVSQLYASG